MEPAEEAGGTARQSPVSRRVLEHRGYDEDRGTKEGTKKEGERGTDGSEVLKEHSMHVTVLQAKNFIGGTSSLCIFMRGVLLPAFSKSSFTPQFRKPSPSQGIFLAIRYLSYIDRGTLRHDVLYQRFVSELSRTEIAKRLNAIIAQILPFLSQEHQQQVATAVDRAKQVTMTELNAIIGVIPPLPPSPPPPAASPAASPPPPFPVPSSTSPPLPLPLSQPTPTRILLRVFLPVSRPDSFTTCLLAKNYSTPREEENERTNEATTGKSTFALSDKVFGDLSSSYLSWEFICLCNWLDEFTLRKQRLLTKQQRPDLPRLLQQMHAQQLPPGAAMGPHPGIPGLPGLGPGAGLPVPTSASAALLGLGLPPGAAATPGGSAAHPLSMLTKPDLHRGQPDDLKPNGGLNPAEERHYDVLGNLTIGEGQ
uniref:Groucho/TLE N-terminal Q-rich domain-containing protein n=1 Tax=Vespula pensylvanica TaxID=30213 RepID=A0A834PHF5_VESPE|nr:hypothetical protein H0235_002019 [Vespula pensylvanica]